MKTATCIGCAKPFTYKPTLPGEPVYLDTNGNVVRCVNEVAPAICPKCLRACREKDGRP